MGGILLRWLVSGVITVVLVTAAAAFFRGEVVEADISTRASVVVDAQSWATVSAIGRTVTLAGIATDPDAVTSAVTRVASLPGVRTVVNSVSLAPVASPYPFAATIAGGKVVLSGGTPDADLTADLVAEAGAAEAELVLLSGVPEQTSWRSAISHAIKYLKQFDDGKVELADLELTVSGRAKSRAAFDALQALHDATPAGVRVASLEIIPPPVSPYTLSARFDGTAVAVSGYAPDAEAIAAITAAAGAVPLKADILLASGAPGDFTGRAKVLIGALARLERGEATMTDGAVELSGAPATAEVAQAVTETLGSAGSIITLEPPRVSPYAFSAQRNGAVTTLRGYVPDVATQQQLAAEGFDATALVLARGAPETFDADVAFGIAALRYMSEGQFELIDDTLALSGRATTVDDFDALVAHVAAAPASLTLGPTSLQPPIIAPYTWSARRDASGAVTISGYVPNDDVRTGFAGLIGSELVDTSRLGDGAPEGFADNAVAGLSALAAFDSGELMLSEAGWSIVAKTGTRDVAEPARAALDGAVDTAAWTVAFTEPPPLPPIADPFTLTIEKAEQGGITLVGNVGSEGFRAFLRGQIADLSTDTTTIARGAPQGFAADAIAGLAALAALNSGTVAFDGAAWSLTGIPQTEEDAGVAISALVDAYTLTRNWEISLADPVVEIEPEIAEEVPVSEVPAIDVPADLAAEPLVEMAVEPVAETAPPTEAVATAESVPETVAPVSSEPAPLPTPAPLIAPTVDAPEPAAAVAETTPPVEASVPLAATEIAPTAAPTEAESAVAVADEPEATAPEATAVAEVAPAEPTVPLAAAEIEPDAGPAEPEVAVAVADEPEAIQPESTTVAETAPMEPVVPLAATEVAPITSPAEPESEVAVAEEPIEPPPEPEAIAETAPAEPTPVAVATVEAPPVLPEPTTAPASVRFDAKRVDGGQIALSGMVPSGPVARVLGMQAGGASVDGLEVVAGLPGDFIANATAGLRALDHLGAGEVSFDGSAWTLKGAAQTSEQREAALGALALLPGWGSDVTLPPPLTLCKQELAGFSDRNSVLFQSGRAQMTDASLEALGELAGYLAECPTAIVNVEGHTDADGAEDLNLALSVARAEAVVDALIDMGVGPDRLYAIGYGEGLPVADNDTNAGKQANRRIVFSISGAKDE